MERAASGKREHLHGEDPRDPLSANGLSPDSPALKILTGSVKEDEKKTPDEERTGTTTSRRSRSERFSGGFG